MKVMLLIGGSHEAWDALDEAAFAELDATHQRMIAELSASGEFIECDELAVTPGTSAVVRTVGGALESTPGPLVGAGNMASGYYLLECRDLERASEIAARLYESRFAPIEVRQVGGKDATAG